MNGRKVRFLVDSGEDVTLIYLITLKKFSENLRMENEIISFNTNEQWFV